MEEDIKNLIKELERHGKSPLLNEDPDAKVNTWFVIAKLEAILLNKQSKE